MVFFPQGCVFSYVIIRSSVEHKRFDSQMTISMRTSDRKTPDTRSNRAQQSRNGDQQTERHGVMVHLEQIVHHDGEEYDSKSLHVV